ncbi:MAG: DUF4143 domain-containing protein [Holophagaceae bacterium]|nr:DUF4143 domain-containing protein [Holophagaceae bacterium]
MESSFLCFRLGPWHTNHRKRLVKAPKLHFYDAGLVCHLLGLRTAQQVATHPLRGAIFESWVASEVMKRHLNQGLEAAAWHDREISGLEMDLVLQEPDRIRLVEIKSGQTLEGSWLRRRPWKPGPSARPSTPSWSMVATSRRSAAGSRCSPETVSKP